jgi:hypothetical protein
MISCSICMETREKCQAHLSTECQPSEQEDKRECSVDPLLAAAVCTRQGDSCIKIRRHLENQ